MTYIGNLAVYTACILCIYLLGINTKKGKKPVILSSVAALLSVIIQVGFDFAINMFMYIISDDGELYSGGAIVWDIFNFFFPLATVIVISMISGCMKKSSVIIVIAGLCLLASVYIEYTEYMVYEEAIANLGDIYEMSAYDADMRMMGTSQEIFNKITPVAYIFLLWVKGKDNNK